MLTAASMILASASPRRRELLHDAGLDFAVVASEFDEETVRHLAPRPQAVVAARGKALDVSRRHPGAWVLGADTVVALDGVALGKPRNARDASMMLRSLAGRDHFVVSAISVFGPGGRRTSGLSSSKVRFAPLSAAEIRSYVDTGEPLGKAGAYAIQGRAGEFARVVSGRQDTVIGLSMALLARLLGQLGHPAAKGLSDNLDPS